MTMMEGVRPALPVLEELEPLATAENERESREFCGVFGIYSPEPARIGNDVVLGLYAVQHRGQDATGVALNYNGGITVERDFGKVEVVFPSQRVRAFGEATIGVGHVRYATSDTEDTSESEKQDAIQPIFREWSGGVFAMASNGHLPQAPKIAERHGFDYQQVPSDTAFQADLLVKRANELGDIEKAFEEVCREFKDNAFSTILMTPEKLMIVRDPRGFRPLVWGRSSKGGYVAASEVSALDIVGVHQYEEVQPGEMLVIDKNGVDRRKLFEDEDMPKPKLCSMEFAYTSRPDNRMYGRLVDSAREEMGRELARLFPFEATAIAGVPESGLVAAKGYHLESGIRLIDAFVRNRYVGRTFIQPTQGRREDDLHIKLNPLEDNVRGQKLVVVDDSLIRGATSRKAMRALREAGVRELYLAITTPPYRWPCFYGMDTDDPDELIARNMTTEQIADHLEVDALVHLPTGRLRAVIGKEAGSRVCTACFDGSYPTEIPIEIGPPEHGDMRVAYPGTKISPKPRKILVNGSFS